MAKVYITNDGGLDFTNAELFGTLVRCSSGKLNVFSPDRIAEDMSTALLDFTEDDFLLLAGGAMSMFFAGAYLPDCVQRLKLLVYDARAQEYFVRTITL